MLGGYRLGIGYWLRWKWQRHFSGCHNYHVCFRHLLPSIHLYLAVVYLFLKGHWNRKLQFHSRVVCQPNKHGDG